MPLSEDFDALRLHLVSAVPQFWADRGHYSYLESPRPEDALLFFLPEESGCAFTLRLDSGEELRQLARAQAQTPQAIEGQQASGRV